jgi:hypothetical protein
MRMGLDVTARKGTNKAPGILGAWIIAIVLVGGCSSPFSRAGATSFAKNHLRNLAREKGMKVYAFKVRDYEELPVYPSDRADGISAKAWFWVHYEYHCPGEGWWDTWDHFRLVRRNGKWEFFEGRTMTPGWGYEGWSCDEKEK